MGDEARGLRGPVRSASAPVVFALVALELVERGGKMSAQNETPPVVIVVPPLLAQLLGELSERMAKAMGEPVDACRRLVEASVLQQGLAAVQREVVALENQAERNGWPRSSVESP